MGRSTLHSYMLATLVYKQEYKKLTNSSKRFRRSNKKLLHLHSTDKTVTAIPYCEAKNVYKWKSSNCNLFLAVYLMINSISAKGVQGRNIVQLISS